MADTRKLKQWQKELTDLTKKTGISLDDVCRYLDLSYNRDLGFYVKLPMRRRTIIGIGMAFRQPLVVINRWITYYGQKRRLYSKDITEDLVWIYLIEKNYNDTDSEINYYRLYDECRNAALETYMTIWSEVIAGSRSTSDVDEQIGAIAASEEISSIKDFVTDNVDSFNTAYAKPRRMLEQYLKCILDVNRSTGGSDSLISLRGWLDDSMINYLSGATHTINVTDLRSGQRVADIKHVPKSRKSHISLAMALGMTRAEIDTYLEMMGYLPLSVEFQGEERLIKELDRWEDEHPLQRAFKEKFINGDQTIELDDEDEQQAVNDMLMLRQELRERYRRRGQSFDYLK